MDKEIFESLISKYSKNVYNIAFRITCNKEDAEDITQETFLKVYDKYEQFENKSNIYTWIYRIALNISLKYKSKINSDLFENLNETIQYYKNSIPDEVRSWENDPEKAFLLNELTREIKQECTYFMTFILTEEQRLVYILRTILGFSYKKIAEILEVEESTIKSRLFRARNNLIKHFKNHCRWLNPKSSCNCNTRIGFAIHFVPEILSRVKKYASKTDDQFVVEHLEKIPKLSDYYRNLPLFDYENNDYGYYANRVKIKLQLTRKE